MVDERDKMKHRIVKLKMRKGKVDYNIKMCKNCGKEFPEKENLNWSCRTHTYDYSGEMWWCCGKRGKDQPGCKFSKHETKEDDDDDVDDDDKNKVKKGELMRCNCCKQVGHPIELCPRDPNLKTNADPAEDIMRINSMKDYKKIFADTVVTTTHMLKKCIKVPKVVLKSLTEP